MTFISKDLSPVLMTKFALVQIYLHICKFAHGCKLGHVNAFTYVCKFAPYANLHLVGTKCKFTFAHVQMYLGEYFYKLTFM